MYTERVASGDKPAIAITERDLESLSRLVNTATHLTPEVAEYLEHELCRAEIIQAGASVEGIVSMGTEVEYRDQKTGVVHRVTLVYPAESDIGRGRVSVLTPVGAALIGLRKGQSIGWTTRSGECRRLIVLSVRDGAIPPPTRRERG